MRALPPNPAPDGPVKLYRWDNRLVKVAGTEIVSVGKRNEIDVSGKAKLPKTLRPEAEKIAYGFVRSRD